MKSCRFYLIFSFFIHGYAFSGDPSLLNLKELAPSIVVEMRYATTQNFTGKKLYDEPICLLCQPVAQRLVAVQKKLEKQGLGLKVWDCYRPLSVQKKLWAIVSDPRYVADPKTGSRHNRGASVDLTLVDSKGQELPMPTGFDEFSKRAHRSFLALPKKVLENRALLQKAMEEEGFVGLPTEWWHFDDPQWVNYALRDEPLNESWFSPESPLREDRKILPEDTQQLLVVTSKNWAAKMGTLQRYEKSNNKWKKIGPSWKISLGLNGMAWGLGLHQNPKKALQKKEGDNRSPAGIFRVGEAYGTLDQPPEGTTWNYHRVNENCLCIDDPNSESYNKIIEVGSQSQADWKSFESMKRKDHLYQWVINIEQNPSLVRAAGSCLFFHVWRHPESPTEGCTAMDENHMVELLKWLKPISSPCLAQMPKEVYRTLRKSWQLP